MHSYPLKSSVMFFVFIASLTISAVVLMNRYCEHGENLLEFNFSKDIALNWEVNRSDTSDLVFSKDIILSNPDNKQYIELVQKLKIPFKSGDMFRLSGKVSTKDVVQGEKASNQARLLMVQYDHQQRPMWEVDHVAFALNGTCQWKEFASVFTVSPQTKDISTVIQMIRCTGQYKVKNLDLKKVQPNTWYHRIQIIIFSFWGFFFIVLFTPLLRAHSSVFSKAVLLFFAAGIIVAATLPKPINSSVNTMVFQQLGDMLPSFAESVEQSLGNNHSLSVRSTTGHLCFFGIFALSLLLINSTDQLHVTFLIFILFAGATECLQFLVPGRTPSFFDFLADCTGALVAYLIYKQFFFKNTNVQNT